MDRLYARGQVTLGRQHRLDLVVGGQHRAGVVRERLELVGCRQIHPGDQPPTFEQRLEQVADHVPGEEVAVCQIR